jgi:ubiquinone/menaquinone biosynthesis C-methylase UbiE
MSVWKEKRKQQTVFDEAAFHYGEGLFVTSQEDSNFFVRKVAEYVKKIHQGGIIIDIGCGTGTLFREINSYVQLDRYYLIGVDISVNSAKIAKEKSENGDFIVCDIEALPFRERISDMIVVRNVLHHLSTLIPIHNFLNVLCYNGFILLDDKINNPIQEILTYLFPMMPNWFKLSFREIDSHVDRNGNLPPIKRYNAKAYLNFLKKYSNNFLLLEMQYHGSFTFVDVLSYLPYLFRPLRSTNFASKLRLLSHRWKFVWSAISITMVLRSSRSSM